MDEQILIEAYGPEYMDAIYDQVHISGFGRGLDSGDLVETGHEEYESGHRSEYGQGEYGQGEYSQEESDIEEGQGYRPGQLVTGETFADRERIGGQLGGGNYGQAPPLGVYIHTPEEQINVMFFRATEKDIYFGDLGEGQLGKFRKHLRDHVHELKGIRHMNILTLALASLFLWQRRGEPFKNTDVRKFLSTRAAIKPVDFIRYVRFLQKFSQ